VCPVQGGELRLDGLQVVGAVFGESAEGLVDPVEGGLVVCDFEVGGTLRDQLEEVLADCCVVVEMRRTAAGSSSRSIVAVYYVSRRRFEDAVILPRVTGRLSSRKVLEMSIAIDRGVDVPCLASVPSRVHGNRGRYGGRRSRRGHASHEAYVTVKDPPAALHETATLAP
jgi:hypothetical protein